MSNPLPPPAPAPFIPDFEWPDPAPFFSLATRKALADEQALRLRAQVSTLDYMRLMFEDVYGDKFVVGNHHWQLAGILDKFVEDIEHGLNPNLMVFLPPRSGKTTMITSALAKILGTHPNWEVIMSSYNEDRGADMGRMVKKHFNHPLFPGLFPTFDLTKDSTSAVRSEFTKGGAMTATGVGTATTGRGARCLPGETLVRTDAGDVRLDTLVHDWIETHVLGMSPAGLVWRRILAVSFTWKVVSYAIWTDSGNHVRATDDHRFLVLGRGYQEAKDLRIGDTVVILVGDGDTLQIAHTAISKIERNSRGAEPVYDIQVEGCRNFFAGGVLVHNCYVIDDPFKDSTEADSPLRREDVWQWYGSVVNTRLAPSGAGIIIALTRWHSDDLAGRILAAARKDPQAPQFQVYSFPAISGDESRPETEASFFPERFSLEWLRKKRAAIRAVNPRMWSALYQQNPVPEEGAAFKLDWFKNLSVPESEFPPLNTTTNCITVDFAVSAGKGDHTAMYPVSFDSKDVCWVRPGHFRKQADPMESLQALEAMLVWFQPTYLFVEKGPIWRTLCTTVTREIFRKARVYPQVIEVSRGHNNKVTVAQPYMNAVQAGLVRYVHGPHYHEVLLPQHMSFGVSDVDDDVDAIALPFVERGKLMLPSDDEPLPEVEDLTWEQEQSAWIKSQVERRDDEEADKDPYPLFAGDNRG
jgi:hypothetical protein